MKALFLALPLLLVGCAQTRVTPSISAAPVKRRVADAKDYVFDARKHNAKADGHISSASDDAAYISREVRKYLK